MLLAHLKLWIGTNLRCIFDDFGAHRKREVKMRAKLEIFFL